MIPHLKRSRITKALTDRAAGIEFDTAEERLNKVRVAVVLSPTLAGTTAGQAAALTAVATSFKCFGGVTLVLTGDIDLRKPLPIGASMAVASAALGADVLSEVQPGTTHVIAIGDDAPAGGSVFVRCWCQRRLESDPLCAGSPIGI